MIRIPFPLFAVRRYSFSIEDKWKVFITSVITDVFCLNKKVYDEFGINVTKTIDKNNNVTEYSYDQIGNQT